MPKVSWWDIGSVHMGRAYIYIYIYIYICTHLYVIMLYYIIVLCVYIYIYIYIYTYIHVHIHMYICICICICTCMYIYIYIYIYISDTGSWLSAGEHRVRVQTIEESRGFSWLFNISCFRFDSLTTSISLLVKNRGVRFHRIRDLKTVLRSISEISSYVFGPRPRHIEIRHRVNKNNPQLIYSDLRPLN